MLGRPIITESDIAGTPRHAMAVESRLPFEPAVPFRDARECKLLAMREIPCRLRT